MGLTAGPVAPSGLVLFLSVDLAGSTAFKAVTRIDAVATQEMSSLKWLPVFTGFYYQFPERLAAAFEKERKAKHSELGDAPLFWKPIGDELVFTKRLTHEDQAFRTVRAFRAAVLEYGKELAKKHPALNLKATAWLAGFPVGNTQVLLDGGETLKSLDLDGEPQLIAFMLAKATQKVGSTARVDYLGPSMDVGFRLGKLSTPRKFVVSIELAYLLSHLSQETEEIRFRYDGRMELKGVLGNRPYPIVWVEMEPTALDKEEDVLNHRDYQSTAQIHRLASLFIDSTDGQICRPYIIGSGGHVQYGDVPLDHERILRLISEAADKEEQRERAAVAPDTPGASEVTKTNVDDLIRSVDDTTPTKG